MAKQSGLGRFRFSPTGGVPPVTFSPALHVLPTYAASAVLPSEALNRIHALPVTRHPLPPAL
eukprot:5536935-Prymnesium_polylepis.1